MHTNHSHISSYILITLLAIAAIMTGCRTQKPSAVKPAQSTEQWQRARVPISIRLEKPQRFSISGNATMVRDSSIVISMRMLGMEVGLVSLTPDSLIIIDKYHKAALAESVASLLRNAGIGFATAQDLLTGRSTSEVRRLSSRKNVTIAANDSTLTQAVLTIGDATTLTADYSAVVATPHGPFSDNVRLTADHGDKQFAAEIRWDFAKARWDDEVEPRHITVPSSYRTINTASLLRLLE